MRFLINELLNFPSVTSSLFLSQQACPSVFPQMFQPYSHLQCFTLAVLTTASKKILYPRTHVAHTFISLRTLYKCQQWLLVSEVTFGCQSNLNFFPQHSLLLTSVSFSLFQSSTSNPFYLDSYLISSFIFSFTGI